MSETLSVLEREVEAARSKLASDLANLRSPETAADFTRALKQEVRSGLQSTMQIVLDDVKARAAANPAAALAVGAGLAWRLIRHPPIATALIGAGLISLFRTSPAQRSEDSHYLLHAKARLKEQALQTAGTAVEQAAAISGSVTHKTAELASAAKERAREWADGIVSSSKQAGSDLQNRASSISTGVADAASELRDRARTATELYARSAQQVIDESETRDKLLLGTAGIAVIAALSIALQRRFGQAER